jgi:hypothetical protein
MTYQCKQDVLAQLTTRNIGIDGLTIHLKYYDGLHFEPLPQLQLEEQEEESDRDDLFSIDQDSGNELQDTQHILHDTDLPIEKDLCQRTDPKPAIALAPRVEHICKTYLLQMRGAL